MPVVTIEQALYGNPEPGGFRFLARSPGFAESWLPLAENLCAGFGERPPGVACPGCLFVQPFGSTHVAVVQVADLGTDDAGRPGALGFRLLVVPRAAYAGLGGDPFLIADRLPPPWQQREGLPTLHENFALPPSRTTAQVLAVVKGPDSANMLGGAQALIDGGRLVFERSAPAPELVQKLWLLLPTSTRAELWPATFAFGNALKFHVIIVPRADLDQFPHYVLEDQAGDYPEGRYELGLQAAAETNDQAELDRMFSRRSSTQTLRLAVVILIVTIIIAVVSNALNPPPPASITAPRPAPPPATAPAMDQPALADFNVPLTEDLTPRVAQALRELNQALGGAPLPASAPVAELIPAVRSRLPAANAGRIATVTRLRGDGQLAQPEQEIRAWLWVYQLPQYNDRRLNLVEVLELLQKKLVP